MNYRVWRAKASHTNDGPIIYSILDLLYLKKKKTVLKTFKFSAATTTVFFIEIKCYNGEKKYVTLRLEHGEI